MSTRTITPERLQAVLIGILREHRAPMESVALSRLCGIADPSECFRLLSADDLREVVRVERSAGATMFTWTGQ
jgi:hypothetical protein